MKLIVKPLNTSRHLWVGGYDNALDKAMGLKYSTPRDSIPDRTIWHALQFELDADPSWVDVIQDAMKQEARKE